MTVDDWALQRDRFVLARLSEGASRPMIAAELDVSVERARQIISGARARLAAERRTASSVATFFYTERFGP